MNATRFPLQSLLAPLCLATTQAPLFGLDASGSIGGAITFAKWRGRTYARVKGTPANPRSSSQLATRAMMRFLGTKWALLSPSDQATFEALAAQGNYPRFNAYVKYNMNRWTQWLDPITAIGQAAGTNPVMGALSLTGGVGQLSVSQVITTVNDIQGVLICLGTAPGFTPAKTNSRYVVNYTASPVTAVINRLAPATYYIRTAGFTKGGARTAFVAEQSVVVT